MSIKATLKTTKITTTLSSRFVDPLVIKRHFDDRIEKTRDAIQEALFDLVRKELLRSKVIQALANPAIGTLGADLVAEFGLRPDEGVKVARLIFQILIETCRVVIDPNITVKSNGDKHSAIVRIVTKFLDPKEYTDKFETKDFEYISTNGAEIKWMQWLLNARKQRPFIGIADGIKNFGILYDLRGKEQKYSRSGRALMLPEYYTTKSGKKRNNHSRIANHLFPYEFPVIARPNSGFNNFIDEIARSEDFVNKLQSRINSIVKQYLTRGS